MAHILGQSGTGKTTLLQQLILEDPNKGVCIIDPVGDLTDALVPYFENYYIFDPTDTRWNPFVEPIDRDMAPLFFANTVKDAYGYDDLTTPVMSMYLSFIASALMDNHQTISDTIQLLTNREYRDGLTHSDPLVEQFFEDYEALSDKDRRQERASTINKFYTMLLDKRLRRLFKVNNPPFTLAREITRQRVLFVRLPMSLYGKDNVSLIGSLILAYLNQLLSLNPKPYSIYIDEVDLFARSTIKELVTRGCRYGIETTVCHQSLSQLDDTVLGAFFGSIHKRHVFRVSADDKARLSVFQLPNTAKTPLDQLPNFTYRTLPATERDSDKRTIPLEK